eukprot:gene11139-20023_t
MKERLLAVGEVSRSKGEELFELLESTTQAHGLQMRNVIEFEDESGDEGVMYDVIEYKANLDSSGSDADNDEKGSSDPESPEKVGKAHRKRTRNAIKPCVHLSGQNTNGYVSDLRQLLFSMPKDRMSSVMEREAELIPDTLTSQFQDRATRQEAINTWDTRQRAITTLFPSAEEQDILAEQQTMQDSTKKLTLELFYTVPVKIWIHNKSTKKTEFQKRRVARRKTMPGEEIQDKTPDDIIQKFCAGVFRRVIDQISMSITERFSINSELIRDTACFDPNRFAELSKTDIPVKGLERLHH